MAEVVNQASNLYVPQADGLGSVRAITDGSDNAAQTLQTDAFGTPTQSQGVAAQPFGFTGQQVDPTGLVYLRARFYDPTSGRFVGRDPPAGAAGSPLSLNHYTHALNNSMIGVDSFPTKFSQSFSRMRPKQRARECRVGSGLRVVGDASNEPIRRSIFSKPAATARVADATGAAGDAVIGATAAATGRTVITADKNFYAVLQCVGVKARLISGG